MDVKPTKKIITYPHLTGEVDFENRTLKITDNSSGEFMTFTSAVYPELQAILGDIGRQPITGEKGRPPYRL